MPQGKHNVCGTGRQVVSALAGIVTLPKLWFILFEREEICIYIMKTLKKFNVPSLFVQFLILKTAKHRQLFQILNVSIKQRCVQ